MWNWKDEHTLLSTNHSFNRIHVHTHLSCKSQRNVASTMRNWTHTEHVPNLELNGRTTEEKKWQQSTCNIYHTEIEVFANPSANHDKLNSILRMEQHQRKNIQRSWTLQKHYIISWVDQLDCGHAGGWYMYCVDMQMGNTVMHWYGMLVEICHRNKQSKTCNKSCAQAVYTYMVQYYTHGHDTHNRFTCSLQNPCEMR